MKEIAEIWQNFWNKPIDKRAYCWTRMLTGLLFLYSLIIYFIHLDEWIVASPYIQSGAVDFIFQHRTPWTLFNLVRTDMGHYTIFSLGVFAVGLFTLGVGGRTSALLSYVFFLSLANRNPAIVFGFDEYMGIFLFLYCVYPGMEYYTILRKKIDRDCYSHGVETIGIRMFQVVFCLLYLSAGFYKPNALWSDGTIIWQLLHNLEMQKVDLSFLHDYWQIFGWVSLSVKFFEIMFVPLIVFRPTRMAAIFFGMMMHFAIGLLTPLMVFSLLLMAGLCVFLPKDVWDKIPKFLRFRAAR